MRSKMTAKQLADLKARSANANTLNQLATKSLTSSGVGRAERERARADLVKAVGPKQAKQLQEAALQRAGARPKGLSRWFG